MAKRYYPFDAGAGGVVTETEWAEMARLWRPTGVVAGEGDELSVSADGTDLTVDVATGVAWVRGFYFGSDAIETLTIADADPFEPRIDRVVVRLDRAANVVDLAVLEGTPDAAPTPPSLTQNDVTWEIEIAQVTVPADASAIASGNVDDTRHIVTDDAGAIEEMTTAETDTDLVLNPDGSGGVAFGSGSSDHGGLTGLSDDDHSQYVLATGSRDITGNQRVRGAINPRPAPEVRAASDLPSAYPEGLTTELVATTDGWPVRGILLTNRRGVNLTYQLLAQESNSGAFYVRKGSDSSWSSFVELADVSGRYAKIATGSYTGDGTTDRTIPLPFTPKYVVVAFSGGYRLSNVGTTGIGARVDGGTTSGANDIRPLLATDGFVVDGPSGAVLNNSSNTYHYFAIG